MSQATSFAADLCIKCNVCTAACPVAAATDLFPGPKAVGPQFERFRHPSLPLPDHSVSWCSGCGVCSRVCPHGVPVTEVNLQAKARLAESRPLRPRDWLLARPAMLATLAAPGTGLANAVLQSTFARRFLQRVAGLAELAPLPPFRSTTLRRMMRAHRAQVPPAARRSRRPTVAYFHGCSTDRYEWEVGAAAMAILERLGAQVVLPPQGCCGLPLQSNGFFRAARAYARHNARKLRPFLESGIPIVATSTSCGLALKHEYRAVLGLEGEEFDLLAQGTNDFFELITSQFADELNDTGFQWVDRTVVYHPPCQLRSHGIGTPALEVLRRIPGLRLILSEAECCGVAGTYGLKAEQFAVARQVGSPLFGELARETPDFVLTDSETCRWWIGGLAHVPTIHPLMLVASAMELAEVPVLSEGRARTYAAP
ncbi:MAG: anaerobic glycerol-3-phosphate dehydrogenase subunit C [Anaerolineales bacterium]